MRVQVEATGLYTCPDVVVGCQERRFLDASRDTLLNPMLIIEVLSESTEAYDRGRKFAHYRKLESLQEYVLVSQDRVLVECYQRQPGDRWLLPEASGPERTIVLDSVGCSLALADIYEGAELAPAASRAGWPKTRKRIRCLTQRIRFSESDRRKLAALLNFPAAQ